MDIKELEQIVKILKANDVTEFELEQDGTSLKLSRGLATAVSSEGMPQIAYTVAPATGTTSPESSGNDQVGGHEVAQGMVEVTSPIVGTFYRKPSPESDPFVDVGAAVEKGQTLCIIEAMKLMNEIEAPSSGVIENILLSDGQVVEFGEVLFLIRPS